MSTTPHHRRPDCVTEIRMGIRQQPCRRLFQERHYRRQMARVWKPLLQTGNLKIIKQFAFALYSPYSVQWLRNSGAIDGRFYVKTIRDLDTLYRCREDVAGESNSISTRILKPT